LAPALVWLLIISFSVLYSWLGVLRHRSFGSSAMDMGYTDQVLWNTIRGRLFRFSTLEGARIDLPLEQFRRTDILLAYHVELLLLPISLLYLLPGGPISLILLQAVGVALGAWPAYRLAAEHLDSRFAGVVIALAYLLAPATEGAVLADFHAVSLTASLLLFAFYAAHRHRFDSFFVFILLALFAKEDISLLVAGIGLYLWLFRGQRRVGLSTAAIGLGWFLLCMAVILPTFNGLESSPFLHRLAIFGPTLEASLDNWLRDPALLLRWLGRREIVAYLGGLLASAGFLSLFAPHVLTLTAPVAAVNVLSTWSWTYSEGEHYSASLVPLIIISATYGMARLSRWLGDSDWLRVSPRRVVIGLSCWVLVVSVRHHRAIGVSPLAETYHPAQVTAHHRLGHKLLAEIPPEAPLSAQSNLYPHLSHRQRAYFYPAINDAEYVVLDVTSSSYPLTPHGLYLETKQLLRSGEFGVLAARDGYLLLQRGLPPPIDGTLPEAFYTFALARAPTPARPIQVRFGDQFELLGYDVNVLGVVQTHELPATVVTYWRVLEEPALDYRFALFFTREDGAIVHYHGDKTSTTVWYPSYEWSPGQVIRMETPVLTVGRLNELLIAVTPPGGDPWLPGDRLPARVVAGEGAELLQQETLVRAGRVR
jgi:uncharacterized membrane protein